MYGIRFSNHPDMTRILLWEGFNGYPLRKDFPVEGIDTGSAIYPEYYEEGQGPISGTGTGWKPPKAEGEAGADAGAAKKRDRGGLVTESRDLTQAPPTITRGVTATAAKTETLFDVEEMELNFGPQHPSTHGVLRLKLRIDGERIIDCYPIIGYLHRGTEKLFELHPFFQNVPHTDRMDYVAAATNNLAYVGAVEKLVGLVVPPRARYIRVLLAELQRISSHLLWLATHAIDIGAMTPFFYCFREREQVLDLFEEYCGARLTLNCMRPGGQPYDFTVGWTDRCREFTETFPSKVDEYEGLLTNNRIWKTRTVGVGILPPEMALDYGISGPMLRGSGIGWDLRKARPYEAYADVQFDVPVRHNCDTYDRYLVRDRGDAAVGAHHPAVPRQAAGRSGDGEAAARAQGPQGGRGLPLDRGTEGRDRVLHRERRHAQPVPLPRARALVHQPAVAARSLPRRAARRPGGDHRHHRHRARRGRSLMLPLLPGWLDSVRQSLGDPLFFYVLSPLVKILVVMFILVLPLVTAMIIIERKVLGFIQFSDRPQPGGTVGPAAADRRRGEAARQGGRDPARGGALGVPARPLPGGGADVRHLRGGAVRPAGIRATRSTSSSPTSTWRRSSSSPPRRSASTASSSPAGRRTRSSR